MQPFKVDFRLESYEREIAAPFESYFLRFSFLVPFLFMKEIKKKPAEIVGCEQIY